MITVFGYLGRPSIELRNAAARADLVVGGRRHLAALGIPTNQDREHDVEQDAAGQDGAGQDGAGQHGAAQHGAAQHGGDQVSGRPRGIVLGPLDPAIEALAALPAGASAVVVASGDPLFYGVVRRIRQAGLRVTVVPAVTSLQAAFAAVALPWDDALAVSVHGNDPAPAFAACRTHPKVGVLTDPRHGLPELVRATAGLGRTYVLAERLGEDDERVRVLTETEALELTDIAQPHVVLVLAHHPDDPEALGNQYALAGGPHPQENP